MSYEILLDQYTHNFINGIRIAYLSKIGDVLTIYTVTKQSGSYVKSLPRIIQSKTSSLKELLKLTAEGIK